jgi:hypothetical protein
MLTFKSNQQIETRAIESLHIHPARLRREFRHGSAFGWLANKAPEPVHTASGTVWNEIWPDRGSVGEQRLRDLNHSNLL